MNFYVIERSNTEKLIKKSKDYNLGVHTRVWSQVEKYKPRVKQKGGIQNRTKPFPLQVGYKE